MLNVGRDLIVDANVDLSESNLAASAQSAFMQLFMNGGSVLNVGRLTRFSNDAIAGLGGNATAGGNQIIANAGASFTTGELSLSSDAIGGIDIGAGGGNPVPIWFVWVRAAHYRSCRPSAPA